MILDFRLKVFTLTAQLSSFSRAAKALNISQPAVSQNIAELEGDIGAELFIRDPGKPIRLTEKGASLLEYAERIISLYDHINAELVPGGRASSRDVELRIGAVRLATQFILPEAIKKLNAAYPSVRITVSERTDPEIEALLRDGEIDLAITEKPLSEESLPFANLSAAGSAYPIVSLWSTYRKDDPKRGVIRNFILSALTL